MNDSLQGLLNKQVSRYQAFLIQNYTFTTEKQLMTELPSHQATC